MKLPILALTIMMVVGSMGYTHPMMHRMRSGEECEMVLHEELGLTAEQKTKIEEIKINTRKTIIPVRSQIELKHIDMEKEMKAEKPNKDKIIKIAREIHEFEWQIKIAHLEEEIAIASILTPEQREKMRMMHKKKMMKKLEIEQDIKE